jgi:hypothetical protein
MSDLPEKTYRVVLRQSVTRYMYRTIEVDAVTVAQAVTRAAEQALLPSKDTWHVRGDDIQEFSYPLAVSCDEL